MSVVACVWQRVATPCDCCALARSQWVQRFRAFAERVPLRQFVRLRVQQYGDLVSDDGCSVIVPDTSSTLHLPKQAETTNSKTKPVARKERDAEPLHRTLEATT